MPTPPPPEATKFKPGCAPGPGRPKKANIVDHAEAFLDQPHPKHPEYTYGEWIALRWVRRACNGKQLPDLLAYTVGKPPDAEPKSTDDVAGALDVMEQLADQSGAQQTGGDPAEVPERPEPIQ